MRLCLALCLLGSSVLARDIPLDQLPPAVERGLKKSFPEARIRKAEFDRYGPEGESRTIPTYELVCYTPYGSIEVLVAEDGVVLEEEFKHRIRLDERVDPKHLKADLDAFEKGLRARFAYLRANGVDLAAEMKSLRALANKAPITVGELGWLLQHVMARFIDGHAEVSPLSRSRRAFLPFLVEPLGDRFVAFKADRSGFLDESHPYLKEMDGRPMAEWIAIAGQVVPQGSPQYRTRHALRWLREIQLCRTWAREKHSEEATLILASADGKKTQRSFALGREYPMYGHWPTAMRKAEPRVLENGIAYLPLPTMRATALRTVLRWMPQFKDAPGLVIDVRGNGGGSRLALEKLYPMLMSPDEAPRVVSAAKYRRAEGFAPDHLDPRLMRRATDKRLTDEERGAIAAFTKKFRPEWEPPAKEFSDWHYFVISKGDLPTYRGRVVVLMNAKSFSATDIFLGALKGRPNVTLVGAASGGGSAYARKFFLPCTAIEIRCASMASFQPDGKLYDTNGVTPDVVVETPPDYFIEGGKDVVLARALELLEN
jgi:hypothetical protein